MKGKKKLQVVASGTTSLQKLNTGSNVLDLQDAKKENSEMDLETIFSSTLYLMTRYGYSDQRSLAGSIAQHLGFLESHSKLDSTLLKQTCRRLRSHWLTEFEKSLAIKAGLSHEDIKENSWEDGDCTFEPSRFSNIH